METLLTWAVVLGIIFAGYMIRRSARQRSTDKARVPPTPPPSGNTFPTSPPLAPLDPAPASTQQLTPNPPPPPPPLRPPATATGPFPDAPPAAPSSVAAVLHGIALPCGLAPLTTYVSRVGATDQVVFVTNDSPYDVVRSELERALTAIGVEVGWETAELATLVRGGEVAQMLVPVSPAGTYQGNVNAYPVLPEAAVVVDIWVA